MGTYQVIASSIGARENLRGMDECVQALRGVLHRTMAALRQKGEINPALPDDYCDLALLSAAAGGLIGLCYVSKDATPETRVLIHRPINKTCQPPCLWIHCALRWATPHNSRLTAKHRSGGCGWQLRCQMLDNVGVAVPASCFGAKAPRTLRPLPSVRCFATGGASPLQHPVLSALLLSICRTSFAVSALRIMRYCHKKYAFAADAQTAQSMV